MILNWINMFIWQSDHMRICFFYSFRFRVYPCSNDDENEQFCFNVGDDYPSTLLVGNRVPPQLTTKGTIGHAATVSYSALLLLFTAAMCCLF